MPSTNNLQESAKSDLSAIATLIEQAFAPSEVQIITTKQFGVVPWFKLKSNESLNTQDSLNVVLKVLNSVKPENINAARVSQVSHKDPKQQAWDEHLELKEGSFVHNKNATTQGLFILAGIIASLFLFTNCASQLISIDSPSTAYTTKSTPAKSVEEPRIFLGKSQTGYELWLDKDCVYVKDVRMSDFKRLNTDLRGFKKAVEMETGYNCVIFK